MDKERGEINSFANLSLDALAVFKIDLCIVDPFQTDARFCFVSYMQMKTGTQPPDPLTCLLSSKSTSHFSST